MELLSNLALDLVIVGFAYVFLRNFKTEMDGKIEKVESKITVLEDRIFSLCIKKNVEEVLVEKPVKKETIKKKEK
jgi:hypothetical protein